MGVVTISNGVQSVVLEEVQERFSTSPVVLDPLPDITGDLVVYERRTALCDLPVSGRVKSKEEAERLVGFVGQEITLTERDGTVTTGWRIRTDPPPSCRRKDGDSADHLVELKLWRNPS